MEAGREAAANRVLRGGSWNNEARNVRSAYRNHDDPANRNDNIGFRCARAHERVGASAPEQACFHGVATEPGVRHNATTAGVLVGVPDGSPNARRPVAPDVI